MDIVLLRFPYPDITYVTQDGSAYRVDGDSVAGVASQHVPEMLLVGAAHLDAAPPSRGLREGTDSAGGFLASAAPTPRPRTRKPA